MPDVEIEIPKRALFKAAEVCDLAKVQPYVLRSWEAEFPQLGVAKSEGAPRTYRREDVEQVLRIKHLLLVEGLTLAGARRRLEEESAPVAADAPAIDELIGRNARERLTEVKRGLRSILSLLGASFRTWRAAADVAGCARRRACGRCRSRVREGRRRRRGTARRGRRGEVVGIRVAIASRSGSRESLPENGM